MTVMKKNHSAFLTARRDYMQNLFRWHHGRLSKHFTRAILSRSGSMLVSKAVEKL